MSDPTPVNPDSNPLVELKGPIGRRLPQRLHPLAKELLELPSKERAKVFRAFDQPQQVVERAMVQRVEASVWQGPLPSPDQLERFNAVVPGAADRLIAMAEKQQDHRMGIERLAIGEQLKQSRRGQFFGLAIGLGGILLSGFLAHLGHAAAAGTVGTTTLAGLAIAFVTGKAQEGRNRRAKSEANP